jgi:hypothetical protein
LGVVTDEIKMCLGPDEKAVPEIVTDAAANVGQQVIAANVYGTGQISAITESVVETDTLAADACHELGAGFLAQSGNIYGVDVVKNGTKTLVAVIESLLGSNCNFSAEADAVLENDIGAEAGVRSAFLRWRQISLGGGVVLGGENGAKTDGDVNLLGVREASTGTRECN